MANDVCSPAVGATNAVQPVNKSVADVPLVVFNVDKQTKLVQL